MSFRYLYDEKSPYSTIDFMKRLIDYFPFRIHCIQSATEGSACGNNGTEFTYRKHSFDTQHPLDIFCKKNYIKRVGGPFSENLFAVSIPIPELAPVITTNFFIIKNSFIKNNYAL